MIFKIIIAVIILSIMKYLDSRFSYRDSKSYKQEAKLSFKTIASIYKINPERWKYTEILADDSDIITGFSKVLLYNSNNEVKWPDIKCNHEREAPIKEQIIRIHLSYLDWLKLNFSRLFKRFPTKGTEAVLESAQQDIDKLRAIAETQIQTANDDISNITKKLSQEEKELYT